MAAGNTARIHTLTHTHLFHRLAVAAPRLVELGEHGALFDESFQRLFALKIDHI